MNMIIPQIKPLNAETDSSFINLFTHLSFKLLLAIYPEQQILE